MRRLRFSCDTFCAFLLFVCSPAPYKSRLLQIKEVGETSLHAFVMRLSSVTPTSYEKKLAFCLADNGLPGFLEQLPPSFFVTSGDLSPS